MARSFEGINPGNEPGKAGTGKGLTEQRRASAQDRAAARRGSYPLDLGSILPFSNPMRTQAGVEAIKDKKPKEKSFAQKLGEEFGSGIKDMQVS